MCNCGNTRRIASSGTVRRQQIQSNPTITGNIQISNIWKRILNNDGFAKQELVKLYLDKYPQNKRLTIDITIQNLHKLYIQLINSV